ncbi:MAG: hypothetical protein OXU73_02365 [Candidatus Campbellbacteria bacterium]|nr:hypothetical protein [Candidatus Campbellbacteria bacterium]
MAKVCPITGKGSMVTGGYSNRVRATKFNPIPKKRKSTNMCKKTLVDPETGKKIKIEVSARGLKTIRKRGVKKTLSKSKLI